MFKYFDPYSGCFAKYDTFCSHIFNYAYLKRKAFGYRRGFEIIEKFYTLKHF